MFAGIELIETPHRVVIGKRGLANGEAEYPACSERKNQMSPLDQLVDVADGRTEVDGRGIYPAKDLRVGLLTPPKAL